MERGNHAHAGMASIETRILAMIRIRKEYRSDYGIVRTRCRPYEVKKMRDQSSDNQERSRFKKRTDILKVIECATRPLAVSGHAATVPDHWKS